MIILILVFAQLVTFFGLLHVEHKSMALIVDVNNSLQAAEETLTAGQEANRLLVQQVVVELERINILIADLLIRIGIPPAQLDAVVARVDTLKNSIQANPTNQGLQDIKDAASSIKEPTP